MRRKLKLRKMASILKNDIEFRNMEIPDIKEEDSDTKD